MARVFISYKRAMPDMTVAQELHRALTDAGHDVFIDVSMPVGMDWAQRIEEELHRTDFLIALLSEQSVRSEMAIGEMGTAHRLKKRILPVRLAYREAFQYPLSAWLDPLNWAYWEGPASTPKLVAALVQAIVENASVQPEQLPPVPPVPPSSVPAPRPLAPVLVEDGTMDVESRFYVKRRGDDAALEALVPKQAGKGQTVSIKGPRQMGKSSMLMRLVSAALDAGKRVAFVDLQETDSAVVADADLFFRNFCLRISEQLDLENRVDAHWDPGLGNVQRCGKYLGDYVLKTLGAPLVLALDEVDRLIDAPYRSDFFGMLRSWHNKRALPTVPIWKQLDLVLVTSTEPNLFIDHPNQSPFNVGQSFELVDFTPDEVTRLNVLHGPALGAEEEGAVVKLLGGHPYLLRRALYLVASGRMSAAELLGDPDLDGGPFGDHLRHLLFLLNRRQELVAALREALRQGTCRDATLLHRLRSAGLVRSEGDRILPRCDLYERYFRKHLLG